MDLAIMQRKYRSYSILSTFLIGVILINVSFVNCWTSGQTFTSRAASEAITVDGQKEDLWLEETVNITYGNLGGRQFTLSMLHFGNDLYFLIELRNIETTQDEEMFSVYISSSNSTTDTSFIDKKELVMKNASQKGYEYSIFNELHLSGGEYINDTEGSESDGAAAYEQDFNRFYEFKIHRFSSNATESSNLTIGNSYAFKIGYRSGSGQEDISEPFLVQLGPRITDEDTTIGELDFDWSAFGKIFHWIVLGLLGIFGIIIFANYPKIKNIVEDAEKYMEEK